MPNLRAKSGPPPGFGAQKVNELADASGLSNFSSTFGKLNVRSSDVNMVRNEPGYFRGSATDAENRFHASLMTGFKGGTPVEEFPLSEGLAGLQGYCGNNSSAPPPSRAESEDNPYLLAQKLTLERQRSLPNPYTCWLGRDAASFASKSEIVQDSILQQPNFPTSVADNARLQQTHFSC